MSTTNFGYSEKLPENIREIFMWLCQDVASLQHKWDFYQELFGSKENTDLLSELALSSFNIIFETLQNEITMAISRLSDPHKSAGQTTLSFATLSKNCPDLDGLNVLVDDFRKQCDPLIQRRNKRVGHRDLSVTINPIENPFPDISKVQIESVIKLSGQILNFVLQKYDNGELYFHTASPGDAKSLIFWLKTAKASTARDQKKLFS